jgi:hypothetical protein
VVKVAPIVAQAVFQAAQTVLATATKDFAHASNAFQSTVKGVQKGITQVQQLSVVKNQIGKTIDAGNAVITDLGKAIAASIGGVVKITPGTAASINTFVKSAPTTAKTGVKSSPAGYNPRLDAINVGLALGDHHVGGKTKPSKGSAVGGTKPLNVKPNKGPIPVMDINRHPPVLPQKPGAVKSAGGQYMKPAQPRNDVLPPVHKPATAYQNIDDSQQQANANVGDQSNAIQPNQPFAPITDDASPMAPAPISSDSTATIGSQAPTSYPTSAPTSYPAPAPTIEPSSTTGGQTPYAPAPYSPAPAPIIPSQAGPSSGPSSIMPSQIPSSGAPAATSDSTYVIDSSPEKTSAKSQPIDYKGQTTPKMNKSPYSIQIVDQSINLVFKS